MRNEGENQKLTKGKEKRIESLKRPMLIANIRNRQDNTIIRENEDKFNGNGQ